MVFDSIHALSCSKRLCFEHQGLLWCLANSDSSFDKEAQGYRYIYSDFMPKSAVLGILRYLRSIGAKTQNGQMTIARKDVALSVSYASDVLTVNLLETER